MGDLWKHEVKFDGYRVQIHKTDNRVTLFSRTGNDFTTKYASIASAVAKIPVRTLILDAELTALTLTGAIDCLLRKKPDNLCVWLFDLLAYKGKICV